MLKEGLVCMVLCSVMAMNVCVFAGIEMKREMLMKTIEEEINASWEEIFAQLKECDFCIIEETQEDTP